MRLPVLPTMFVAAAVAAMIGLGIWQVQRAQWKEKLIAGMEATQAERRATIACSIDAVPEVRAGRSRSGESGYRYLAGCGGMKVDIGWSQRPDLLPRVKAAGPFTGTREPGEGAVVLDTPLPPLEPSAVPSAAELPNNHILYAAQWFFFAGAAAVIYLLALRRRIRKSG